MHLLGSRAIAAPFPIPSPLNRERAGVRGDYILRQNLSEANAVETNHPSPSFPLPVKGRGRSSYRYLVFFLFALTALATCAATISENFTSDPLAHGWTTFGDASLFHWNATNQNLEVTWDSSRTNSYFQLPLGTILSKSDDFSLSFDLRLQDIMVGSSSNKPYTFELAIGFLNSVNSTRTNYFRGTGVNGTYGVRNAIEFAYFPASGAVTATFAPTAISSNNVIRFAMASPMVYRRTTR
jgi:hypothetical protein